VDRAAHRGRRDAYRERGYSAYVEMAPSTRFAFGVSSLFTRAERDIYANVCALLNAAGRRTPPSPNVPNRYLRGASDD
jgi:hypothetical protein